MENNEKELEEIKAIEEREIMTTEEDMDKNNNENRRFYVYEHIRLDNNTCFYVGKGTGNRAYKPKRNKFYNNIRNSCDCKVVIIKDSLTEEEAFKLETERIEDYVITFGYGINIEGYDDYDHNLPYLTNFTWGGEGASGIKRSEEEKQKISKAKKGKKNSKEHNKNISKSRKGIQFSEEHKKKISESHEGIQFSEEHKQNIGESVSGEKNGMWGKPSPNRSKVICITTGKIFNSQTEASNYYNVVRNNISCCCRGKLKSAGKLNGTPLKWKYVKDYNNDFKGILINPITE